MRARARKAPLYTTYQTVIFFNLLFGHVSGHFNIMYGNNLISQKSVQFKAVKLLHCTILMDWISSHTDTVLEAWTKQYHYLYIHVQYKHWTGETVRVPWVRWQARIIFSVWFQLVLSARPFWWKSRFQITVTENFTSFITSWTHSQPSTVAQIYSTGNYGFLVGAIGYRQYKLTQVNAHAAICPAAWLQNLNNVNKWWFIMKVIESKRSY